MSKEMWFQSYEQLLNELEDEGMDPDAASEKAADMASDHMVERMADMADHQRMQRKERGI